MELDIEEELKPYEEVYGELRVIHGEIIASGVSLEDFLEGYEGQHVEWVDGEVVQMPGIDIKHTRLMRFLSTLIQLLLDATTGGEVLQDPMLMVVEGSSRAPDIQVLLPHSAHKYHHKKVNGAADLVVEIVSTGSQITDRVDKLKEYERGGVPEYWIVDHEFEEALFFQRNSKGKFVRVAPDENGIYTSAVLPQLRLPVKILWQETLPTIRETLAMVEGMLA